jgi:hypothetical protein
VSTEKDAPVEATYRQGQQVQITQDTSSHRRAVGDVVTLDHGFPTRGQWRIKEAHEDTGYRPWVYVRDLAPLDPSKVKAGDTVTVEVTDPKHGTVTIKGKTWEEFPGDIAVGPYLLAGEGVTITAHQPAPEPEPEWKPGTVLLGNLPGPYPDDQFWVVDDGETDPYVVDDTGVKHYPADLLNVREAVVIDPADADRIRAAAIATGVSTPKLRAVLEHLGLNR